MDRFIEACSSVMTEYKSNLKSNMDRFIAISLYEYALATLSFKIQYG